MRFYARAAGAPWLLARAPRASFSAAESSPCLPLDPALFALALPRFLGLFVRGPVRALPLCLLRFCAQPTRQRPGTPLPLALGVFLAPALEALEVGPDRRRLEPVREHPGAGAEGGDAAGHLQHRERRLPERYRDACRPEHGPVADGGPEPAGGPHGVAQPRERLPYRALWRLPDELGCALRRRGGGPRRGDGRLAGAPHLGDAPADPGRRPGRGPGRGAYRRHDDLASGLADGLGRGPGCAHRGAGCLDGGGLPTLCELLWLEHRQSEQAPGPPRPAGAELRAHREAALERRVVRARAIPDVCREPLGVGGQDVLEGGPVAGLVQLLRQAGARDFQGGLEAVRDRALDRRGRGVVDPERQVMVGLGHAGVDVGEDGRGGGQHVPAERAAECPAEAPDDALGSAPAGALKPFGRPHERPGALPEAGPDAGAGRDRARCGEAERAPEDQGVGGAQAAADPV